MATPAFSIFSALSELFVTAGVLYLVRRNWTRRAFPGGLFLAVALFEALVNVLYMANRAAQASASRELIAPGLRIFYASHGLLSLLAYIAFVVLGVFAYQDQRREQWFFRDRPALMWTFLVVWSVSIVSGEAIFVIRYLWRA